MNEKHDHPWQTMVEHQKLLAKHMSAAGISMQKAAEAFKDFGTMMIEHDDERIAEQRVLDAGEQAEHDLIMGEFS